MFHLLIVFSLLWLCASPVPAQQQTADSASLQFTVPAPDPAMAGEDINFQVIAVNSGSKAWPKGSYYWVAEIYDMEYNFIAKTEEVSPPEEVAPGAVAAVMLKFHIPDTFIGRKLCRVFLVKDGKMLIQSDYKVFQIIEKKLKPPPQEKYKVGGDITVTYKNSSRRNWKDHNGATTANIIGKISESSFLFNAYLLHRDGKIIDPYIVLLNYYAPWGRIAAGDVSPTASPLSLQGQGMRGAALEQQKGRYSWLLFGGRTVTSQPGDLNTNGRYERQIFGLKASVNVLPTLKVSSNYVFGADDTSSLSSNPGSERYTGPTLAPQKNPIYGISFDWELAPRLSIMADFQKSEVSTDTLSNLPAQKDSAWKAEAKWDRKLFKAKAAVQRTGPKFVSFGSPSAVSDRMTFDGNLSLYPAQWMSLTAIFNRYKDNLENDPGKVTTTQTQMTFSNSMTAPTETVFNVLYSLNTAVGEPRTNQDNRTTTLSLGITQPLKRHSVSLGYQISKFIDNNKLSSDIDSNMISLSAALSPTSKFSCSLSAVNSKSKSEGVTESSVNKNNSYSASVSYSMPSKRLAVQAWTTYSSNKNDSTLAPSDSKTLTLNSEVTWAKDKQTNITFGLGRNDIKDKIYSSRDIKEITAVLRYGYSF